MSGAVRDYRDLSTWQRAIDLTVVIYRATERYPAAERFGLGSQMRRAAASVPANIAEGNARCSRPAYVNHLNIALGSIAELRTLIELSSRLQFLSTTEVDALSAEVDDVARLLFGLRRSLQRPQSPA